MRFDATLANLGTAHVMQVHDGRWVPYVPE
jgi:hypothetical protein